MIHPQNFRHGGGAFGSLSALLLVIVVLCAACGAVAASQSGRRTPGASKRNEPAPTATPETTGESESQPRNKTSNTDAPRLTFVVCEFDDPFLNIAYLSSVSIVDAFAQRVGEAREVEVRRGEKLTRQDARARAKKEKDAYTVLVVIEDEANESGRGGIGREVSTRSLAMRYYVYAPQTGDLRYQDRIVQRPYSRTATIGGVRVPLPTPAPRTAIPAQYEVEQMARDAANSLLVRFHVPLPPEN